MTDSYRCHRLADCRNEVGTYSCHCKSGYKGDGKTNCEGTSDNIYTSISNAVRCSQSISTSLRKVERHIVRPSRLLKTLNSTTFTLRQMF